MKMKEVTEQTGLTERTVRYYMEKGLIAPHGQWRNGREYTEFDETDIARLKAVATLRELGFSVEAIRSMQAEPGLIPQIVAERRQAAESESKIANETERILSGINADDADSIEELANRCRAYAARPKMIPNPLPLPKMDEGNESGMGQRCRYVPIGIQDKWNWGAFLLPLLVLIVGPTEFITNSIINAIGLTTQNFLQMSLFTDPLGDGSFTRNWTVFYWLWWISYTPGVAMFVTRVSRGRKIKEVIWGLILGSTVGCWFFFGVMESYAIHQFINGVINVPQVLETLGGETAVQQVLMSLPAGKLFLAAYLGVMIIFLASHMDAVAYTMAATSTRNLQEGDDPDRGLRLFWCVVITLIPLSILFTGASLETMKTTVVLTALPFLVILLVKVGGFIRWLKQDYADIPAHQVEHYLPQTPVEALEKTPVLPAGTVFKGDN